MYGNKTWLLEIFLCFFLVVCDNSSTFAVQKLRITNINKEAKGLLKERKRL
ncbi:hypothetical protein HMPREF9018_1303 [Prevotella amnii CRIS 21A-A]|uniref:Uncharacterized protein n=1 Tax=Prevotella amnii CRIS 21A-A TaxID=679191 RepID=E1GXJ0_9BACT|nr:hypothetical protein HMPREF9018_1303 [Prevotella amnii CRIS 21A-A]